MLLNDGAKEVGKLAEVGEICCTDGTDGIVSTRCVPCVCNVP